MGNAYMNHAGGGMYGTGRFNRTNDDKVTGEERREASGKPTNKIVDEVADMDDKPAKRESSAQPWVRSMDDASLRYYLHRETKRINELHRALEVAKDMLQALEAVAEERGLDIYG